MAGMRYTYTNKPSIKTSVCVNSINLPYTVHLCTSYTTNKLGSVYFTCAFNNRKVITPRNVTDFYTPLQLELNSSTQIYEDKNYLPPRIEDKLHNPKHPGGPLEPLQRIPKLLGNWSLFTKQRKLQPQSNYSTPRAHNARQHIPGLKICPTRPIRTGATPNKRHENTCRMPRTLLSRGEQETQRRTTPPR